MPNQQPNLEEQFNQGSSLVPSPGKQDKFWSIQWQPNRIAKISGVICLIAFVLSFICFLLYSIMIDIYWIPEGIAISPILFMSPLRILSVIVALLNIIISFLWFKKLDKTNKIFLVMSLIIIVFGIFYISRDLLSWRAEELMRKGICHHEVKTCPDGTTVNRTGPNCEFAPCLSDPTAGWQTYRNEELGISFKYPKEWGETQYEDNYKNLDIGTAKNFGFPMNVIRFSAFDILTPTFGIIPIKFIPEGIYTVDYEGNLFLKLDLIKERQYLERANIGDKCFEAEYNALANQDYFSCQTVSLNKENTIKAQLSYAYFVPGASVIVVYNFYAGDFKFSVSDNFNVSDKLPVDARNVIVHDKKIINNFIESLKNKTASPDIIKRLSYLDLMLYTFKFIE